jgi:hypothetical protein
LIEAVSLVPHYGLCARHSSILWLQAIHFCLWSRPTD